MTLGKAFTGDSKSPGEGWWLVKKVCEDTDLGYKTLGYRDTGLDNKKIAIPPLGAVGWLLKKRPVSLRAF